MTVAASFFLCDVINNGARFGDAILFVAAWGVELLDPPQIFRLGLVTPLVYGLVTIALIARRRVPAGDHPRSTSTMVDGCIADA